MRNHKPNEMTFENTWISLKNNYRKKQSRLLTNERLIISKF